VSASPLHRRSTAVALLLATGVPGLLAQDHGGEPTIAPPTLSWPEGRVLTDTTADGAIWAAAPGWKAGFAAGGVTFIPFLGSDVPSQPVTFTLKSLAANGADVATAAVGPVQHGQRVTFDRGTVREFYDLRPDGIEQQFAFDTLTVRGALELTIAVAGDFTAARDGDGFAFLGANGGVRYGRATAIDAAGRRLDLATEWAHGALRITVPASFVAEASLPLLVDPMIGAISALTPSALELRSTDIAFDASLGQYVVCYERSFSGSDHDVYAAYLDAQMQPLGLLTVDYTNAYWTKPRIATLEAHDQACVVAQTSSNGLLPPWAVRARRIDLGANPVVHPAQSIADLAQNNALDPDIGGDANPVGPTRYLVAHEWGYVSSSYLSSTLSYKQLGADGGLWSPQQVSHGGFMRRPSVSKSCGLVGGGSEAWAIVYLREPGTGGNGPLTASFVDRAGTLLYPNGYQYMTVANDVDNATAHWTVSSVTNQNQGRRYFCAERRVDQANGRGAIFGHVFDRLGNLAATGIPLVSSTLDRGWPVADSDGCRFALAHTSVFSPSDIDVRVNTFAFHNNQLVLQDVATPATASDREISPSLCAAVGAGYNLYGMAWIHQSGGSWAVECQRYRGVATGGVVSRPTGCGGLTIQATSTVALGETCTIAIGHPTGVTGFVGGTPMSAPIAPCPACTQGATGFTLLGTSLSLTVPAKVELVGMTVAVQGFSFTAGGQPCLGQIAFSNTLDLTVQ
jgi:hypothetical protein